MMDERGKFLPRHLAERARAALADTPVVSILGPRQSGKTTLAQRLDAGRSFISLDESRYYEIARRDPSGFVASLPEFVTLDEVQRAPAVLNAIKRSVDRNRRPGRFLLTGSANLLLLPTVTESLAGREEGIYLLPLTEAEKERRPGRFLHDLLSDSMRPAIRGERPPAGPTLPERLVAGGYPPALASAPDRRQQWHREYLRDIIRRDVRDIARIRDVNSLLLLLKLLAAREGHLFVASKLSSDLQLDRATIGRYVAVLEHLFLIRKLPAWHSGRAARLVTTPKVHLLDSGLAATLADLTPADWLHQRPRMSHLLESFVVQQLVAQAAWTDPELKFWHYRDKDQVEVDLVMTRGGRVWGFEVKASSSLNDDDGQGLARLARRCGKQFQRGIVFYAGPSVLPMPDRRMLTVPLSELWER